MIKPSSRAMHYAHIIYYNLNATGKNVSWAYAVKTGWKMLRFRQALSKGIVHFEFYKNNGELREAKATLHPLLIPADKMHKTDIAGGQKDLKPNFKAMPFFDLEKNEWRSFAICNLYSIKEIYRLEKVITINERAELCQKK